MTTHKDLIDNLMCKFNGVQVGQTTLFNCDCNDLMAHVPEKHFELACVDPPYGLGKKIVNSGGRFKRYHNKNGNWDIEIPRKEYFDTLFRISDKQIIFGGNYFELPVTGGWIFWDKDKGKDVSFADGELAWTNFLPTLKKVCIRYDGFIGADILRIHPTQKPVKLYQWLLTNYAKPGQKIIDTHLGSGSSAIAAHYFGVDFVGVELDEDYYKAAVDRFNHATAQVDLFCE